MNANIIRENIQNVLAGTHTSIPAIVQSYDSTSQTVNVQIATETPNPYGSIPAQKVTKVPVLFPQGSDWVIAGPLRAGDAVLLIVPHYGIEGYLEGAKNKVNKPLTAVYHDVNEAVAISGMFTYKKPTRKESLQDVFHIAKGNTHIAFNDSSVDITTGTEAVNITSGSNKIETTNSSVKVTVGGTVFEVKGSGVSVTGNLTVSGNVTAAEVSAGLTNLTTHIHTGTTSNNGTFATTTGLG